MSVITNTNAVPSNLLAAMNGTSATSSGATASGSAASVQNQFMTMLVAQLKNQDPLNPMDNAQVTSQMAQLSTVQGIQQLNTTVNSLMSSMQTSQTLQAASMVGKGVLVDGSSLNYSGTATNFGVNLATAADTVNVSIVNAAGQTVDSFNLGAQSAGVAPLQWNGTDSKGHAVPNGAYSVQVTASAAGSPVTAQPLQYGTVSSVMNGASGPQLNVSGVGAVALSSVAQAY